MSTRVVLDLNYNFYIHVLDYLRELLPLLDDSYKIEDVVHCIQIIEEVADSFFAEQNKKHAKEVEISNLMADPHQIKDYDEFMEILIRLDNLNLTPAEQFAKALELHELFENIR